VCTGHCTVQCPVHRQPRAQIQLSCALSGVHRTGTVDCPVRPYRVFKIASSPQSRARGSFYFPASARCSLSVAIPPPPRRSPPAATISGGAPVTLGSPLLPPSVSRLVFSPVSLSLCLLGSAPPFAQIPNPFESLSIPVNPIGGMSSSVSIVYPC
jgi:hypothetical protein